MKKNILIKLSLSVATALLISGCSSDNTQIDTPKTQKPQQIESTTNSDALQSKVDRLETQNAKKDEEIASLKAQLEEKKSNDAYILQDARAGECYAQVKIPAEYEEETVERLLEEEKSVVEVIPATYKVVDKKVKIREASSKIEIIPETYKTVEEEIMIEPERVTLEVVPATYKTVTEEVLVTPATTKIVTIPETYKTVEEEVLVSPATTEWKKGRGEIEKIDNATGEIMCLVEIPAVYKTITKRVIDEPTKTQEVEIPAVYKTVTKKVVDTPATTKEVVTPAVYKTIEKKVVDTPATTKEVEIPAICKNIKVKEVDTPESTKVTKIPAVYDTYITKKKVRESYLRWQSILCETNTKPGIVTELQETLQAKGYAISQIDGDYGKETQEAVLQYQRDNQLGEGALTIETLESLGLQ
jgi:outer membrane murein-binding lipoprotein Lpp